MNFGMLLIRDVSRVGSIVAICLFFRLKKKKGSFFQSITSLQKNSAKVSSRRDALEEKSAGARNDYLLSLSAANAHQVIIHEIGLFFQFECRCFTENFGACHYLMN